MFLSTFRPGGLSLGTSILVSVIIPAFNASRTIVDTLSSLAASFGRNPCVEIVVVDDGSTDDTASVVRAMEGEFSLLRVIPQINQGVAVARNRGVIESRGAWIYFIDSDDVISALLGFHLPRLVEEHQRKGARWFSFTYCKFLDGDVLPDELPVKLAFKEIDFFDLNPLRFPMCVGTVLIERDALIGTGMFRAGSAVGEDLEVWAKLGFGFPLWYSSDCLLYYRKSALAGLNSREFNYQGIFPAIRWLLGKKMLTAAQIRFLGSYSILNIYALKRSSAGRTFHSMHELLREVGRVSRTEFCRLVLYSAMPLLAFDLVRRIRRVTADRWAKTRPVA